MKIPSLRTLIGSIGFVVVAATCLIGPIGYSVTAYNSLESALRYRARIAAERTANFIDLHPVEWKIQNPRIVELIEGVAHDMADARLRVVTADKEVVADVGPPASAPVLSRMAPIDVAGEAMGRAEISTSLRPLLLRTALVALISCLLGIGMYFAVRWFPLSVLDETLGKLQQRDAALEFQNFRFEAALTNMNQGLTMFDADGRFVVFNRRYCELLDIPPGKIELGMNIFDFTESFRTGSPAINATVDKIITDLRQFVATRVPNTTTFTRANGRVIEIHREPTPDGGWIDTFTDITARRRAEAHIAHLALHDTLTGLPNRTYFYDRMQEYLARARHGEPFAVFMLDLDDFKSINDTMGHPAGDQLLRALSDRLRVIVSDGGMAARFGGDEFAVVLPARDDEATNLAVKLIESVSGCYDLDGRSIVVGVSVGVAMAPGDGTQSDELVKNADLALYRAKNECRNAFRFFEPQMDERLRARRALEIDLRNALAEGQFELHYQPIICMTSGRVRGLEALIRWRHPQRGLVPPAKFIKIAEETGLIVPIGAWVLKQACADAVRWPDDVRVDVNVSSVQFQRHYQLCAAVDAALAESGLPPQRLELEITESVLVDDDAFALATLHQLRDIGAHIALDDFGTGYSSLNYLRKFPFDKIKIDQSFVRELLSDKSCLAIVRAVVDLSTSLGVVTTAEGVETAAQLELLRREGCDEVQGYFFSAPRPIAEIEYMLHEMPGAVLSA
jgi:diguanylate cyclase (GGDEF)-like protein